MSVGVDYGRGLSNVDLKTGIRYGVIPANALGEAWASEAEAYYGEPACPTCGRKVVPGGESDSEGDEADESNTADYWCAPCEAPLDSDQVYGDEAVSWYVDTPELKAEQGQDGDIFVTHSLYVTRASYCSPCAPGACYLTSPNPDGPLAYCFGPDWFEDGKAPYPVMLASEATA